jgi:hypothetical protein
LDDQPVETTLGSLTEAPPRPSERRSSDPYLSLLRVGTLIIGDRRDLCLIRNISAGGMIIRAYSPVSDGTALSIELREGEPVTGSARWSEDGLTGVAFDKPIDVVELLAPLEDGPRPRMPRIELERTAWVREGAKIHRSIATNISQGGVCVQSPAELTLGAEVVVTLAGLRPVAGIVKWRDAGRYGIGFNRVVPLAELVEWLQDQQPEKTEAAV